jgi:vancomycin permeability regulator SanA
MAQYLIRNWPRILLLLLVGGVLLPTAAIHHVAGVTRPYRYTEARQVPEHRVAVIFGAGVRPDGRLTRMLADRVQAGVQLYEQGRVQKLLMTGDNSRVDYNEVSAMKRYAMEQGVPAEAITLDYAGFRTYDSCYRARDIFGLEEAVLVTQNYHLPRAVYTCRQLGVEAVGFGTPDWGMYPEWLLRRYTIREVLATLNALVELHITHPLPLFLGPYEGIE